MAQDQKQKCMKRFWNSTFEPGKHIKQTNKGVALDQISRLLGDLNFSTIGKEVYISPKLVFSETSVAATNLQSTIYTRSEGTVWIDNSVLSSTEEALQEIKYAEEKLQKKKMAFLGQHVVMAKKQSGKGKNKKYVDSFHTMALCVDISNHRCILFEPMREDTRHISLPGPDTPFGKLAMAPELGMETFHYMRGQQEDGEVECMKHAVSWLYNIANGITPCVHVVEDWIQHGQGASTMTRVGATTPGVTSPASPIPIQMVRSAIAIPSTSGVTSPANPIPSQMGRNSPTPTPGTSGVLPLASQTAQGSGKGKGSGKDKGKSTAMGGVSSVTSVNKGVQIGKEKNQGKDQGKEKGKCKDKEKDKGKGKGKGGKMSASGSETPEPELRRSERLAKKK